MRWPTGLALIAAVFMTLGSGCLESPEARAARLHQERLKAETALEQQRLFAEKAQRARSAMYIVPKSRVWTTLYALLAADHEIKRESESRGYIQTEWLDVSDTRKYQIEAEVVGDETVRVVIKVRTQERSRKLDFMQMKKVTTPWSEVARWTEKEDELYVKLWEAVQGE